MIRLGSILSCIIILCMVTASMSAWIFIPDTARIPIHWSLQGEPNRYTSKGFALTALPIIALFQNAFLICLPTIGGQREDIEKSAGFYLAGWVSSIAVLGFVHFSILSIALGTGAPSLKVILVLASVAIMVLGNFMAKSRPNSVMGVRTVWTTRSNHAWMVGNRIAGWGLVVTGLITMIALFMSGNQLGIAFFFAGNASTLLTALIISYLAARSDPDSHENV